MSPRSIITKVFRGEFSYIFGRFLFVRKLYSAVRKRHQVTCSWFQKSTESTLPSTIFQNFAIDTALSQLEKDGVCFGLSLSSEAVTHLQQFAKETELVSSVDYSTIVKYEELSSAQPNGFVAMGTVKDPLKSTIIQELCRDPVVIRLASNYLGYRPKHVKPKIWWSFVTNLSIEERRRQSQTIDFHIDMELTP